jgi:hypothetical protein
MAGYSGTELPVKLGIKDTSVVGIVGLLRPAHLDIAETRGATPPFDVLLVFVTLQSELRAGIEGWGADIARNGGLWICWPKKSARKLVPSDMTEDIVREVALPLGLVDNKVCAVDDVWSGLRLVWRKELR